MKRHILSLSTCLVFSTSAMANTNNVNSPASYKSTSLATSSNLLHRVNSQNEQRIQRKNTNVLKHLTAVASSSVSNFKQAGLASWYSKQSHNEKMTSGEMFNMNTMTASHQTLSLGSYVKVTNKANGKSVIVKINDRIDKNHTSGKSILDLSYGAAKKIGMDNQKLGKVIIERVSTPINFTTYKSI